MAAGIVWFILLGCLYIFSAIFLYRTSPYLSAAVVLLALLHGIFRGIRPNLSRYLKVRSVRRKISACIDEHLEVLARKRRQMVWTDDYGLVHYETWDEEKDYFISQVLGGLFADLHSADFPLSVPRIDAMIDKRIDEYLMKDDCIEAPPEYGIESRKDNDQEAYRLYCTRLLSLAGWRVVSSKEIENNGHILAERDGVIFALACRKSSGVGSRHIRDLISTQKEAGADLAAVVTDRPYSRWIRMASSRYGIMLLHHDDLADVE